MDISRFKSKNTGQVVEISGLPGVSHAFIPASLPPHLNGNGLLNFGLC